MIASDFIARLEAARGELVVLRARQSDPSRAHSPEELDAGLEALLGTIEGLCVRVRSEPCDGARDAALARDPSGPSVVDAWTGAGPIEASPMARQGEGPFVLLEGALPPDGTETERAAPSAGAPSAAATNLAGGEHEAAVHRDRLRSLAAEIVVADEYARRSLAGILHEGLGQDLALARLKLSTLRCSIAGEVRDTLVQVEGLVAKADRSIHSITFQLSPPSLHDLGLVPALEWLAEDAQTRLELDVRIEEEGHAPIRDGRMRVILFRAVRELLDNVAMHSGVKSARVRVRSGPLHLRISVEDDGKGFDATIVDLHGYGLFGIQEQLRHLGGSMLVDSRLGSGTTVVLAVPLPAAEDGAP